MKRLIRELRRREVFRTAGLYVGICWILIESSSVLLPTFEAPDWALKGIIIAAFVGFPIMLVLAWIYDFTGHGIEVQHDATDTIVEPIGSRKMDFVVIGILSVALIFSVYLNVTGMKEPPPPPDPVSVLIADFRNETGNPLFDGLLEQALTIGIEGAPYITSYQRNNALAMATRLQDGVDHLDIAAARLVAVREGINLVLSGSIVSDGDGFDLSLEAIAPETGEEQFSVSSKARSADAVLTAVGHLSEDVREEMGDTTVGKGDATSEAFTATSLEAAQAYTTALDLAYAGKHEEAVDEFRKATELDPKFGRAYSGWALSEFKLGHTAEATELWDKALSLMDTMTERERLRTLGLYYASVTGNFDSAVQAFSELVEKYPADAAGHNNLAVTAFMTLDFKKASEEGRRIMEIYPASELYRSNFALYSMYSGDFRTAADVAGKLVADNPGYGTSYLPLAIASIDAGKFDEAAEDYRRMAEAVTSHHRRSLADLGLADLAMYRGQFGAAKSLLQDGIDADTDAGNTINAATKYVALAEAALATGDAGQASASAARALALSQQDSVRTGAARVLIGAGETEKATTIAAELSAKLQPQARAYGMMLRAMLARRDSDYARAVDLLRGAIELADLWLVRFELGQTYLAAGYFAESLSEFTLCQERRGEAAAVFLDEMPTYRYTSELPYWIARAESGVGMQSSSRQKLEQFLALRPDGGRLADDARQRLD